MRSDYICLTLLGIASALSAAPALQQIPHQPGQQNPNAIACRAMEVHSDAASHVTLIIFHQRDDTARAALAELLRTHSGDPVGIQSSENSPWQRATVFRLKSCFGRSLLVIPSGEAPLKEDGEFLLRFPSN